MSPGSSQLLDMDESDCNFQGSVSSSSDSTSNEGRDTAAIGTCILKYIALYSDSI